LNVRLAATGISGCQFSQRRLQVEHGHGASLRARAAVSKRTESGATARSRLSPVAVAGSSCRARPRDALGRTRVACGSSRSRSADPSARTVQGSARSQ
jgi:hypothetical protein